MLSELEKQSLEVVAKNALEYLLVYGKEAGVVALTAQLLTLQVDVMKAIAEQGEKKKYTSDQSAWGIGQKPAQKLPNEELIQQMMKEHTSYQSRMMQNTMGTGWNTQEEGEKNEER